MWHLMTVIPPIQKSMLTTSEPVFWVLIGLLVVLFVVATVLWIVGNRHIAQRKSLVKEAGHQYETLQPLYGVDEPHPIPAWHDNEEKEEEEEMVVHR